MRSGLVLVAIAMVGGSTMSVKARVVIFNDSFDDGSPTQNSGAGAVGTANAWTPKVGGFPQHTASIDEADGRATVVGTSNTTPYALGQINSREKQSYAFFDADGLTFSYTLSHMNVANANTQARPDVPGAGLGAIRYELGVISNKDAPEAVDELYRTDTGGGFFVNIWKDGNGLLTGNVRVVNEAHQPTMEFVSDSEGAAGLKTLATFTLPELNGLDPFDVAFHLDSAGYTLSVDGAQIAAGSYGLRGDGVTSFLTPEDFATGAYLTASGQGWGSGYGSLSIDNVSVIAVPEPATMIGVASVMSIVGRRRRR